MDGLQYASGDVINRDRSQGAAGTALRYFSS